MDRIIILHCRLERQENVSDDKMKATRAHSVAPNNWRLRNAPLNLI